VACLLSFDVNLTDRRVRFFFFGAFLFSPRQSRALRPLFYEGALVHRFSSFFFGLRRRVARPFLALLSLDPPLSFFCGTTKPGPAGFFFPPAHSWLRVTVPG